MALPPRGAPVGLYRFIREFIFTTAAGEAWVKCSFLEVVRFESSDFFNCLIATWSICCVHYRNSAKRAFLSVLNMQLVNIFISRLIFGQTILTQGKGPQIPPYTAGRKSRVRFSRGSLHWCYARHNYCDEFCTYILYVSCPCTFRIDYVAQIGRQHSLA